MRNFIKLDFNRMPYSVVKEEWEKVSLENREVLQKYDQENKRNCLSETSRSNSIQFLILVAKTIKKPLKEISSEDVNEFMDSLNVNNGSRGNYTIHLRKFFRWLHQDENPECIKDLKVVKVKENKLKFSDMLTEEDIKKLIDVYPDPEHKALVAVLYDSACRCGELVGLKRKDVVCNNGQWIICVDGKTGIRNVPLTLSVVYLEPWFNRYHPVKDSEAPLFISMSRRDMYKNIQDRKLSVVAVWQILKTGEHASGLKKKIHPHLLRHSRLTWLSDHGMYENMMRIYAGWTNGSNMPAVYLHTNPQKIVDKINEIQGSAPPEQLKPEPSKLLPKECPRCHTKNDAQVQYCSQCWLPLNIKVSMAETLMVDLLRSTIYKDESEIAKEEGRYLDIEHLAGKLQEWKQDSSNPKRKQVKALSF